MRPVDQGGSGELTFDRYTFPVYGVSRRDRQPLLDFLIHGLQECGCTILYQSDASFEPFVIVAEAPSGERLGVVAYAFLANHKEIKNRPPDEHRFQVKLGSDTSRLLHMLDDRTGLIATLFVGIDTERGFLVGADPVLNNPSRMFKMIGFKREHVDVILAKGWHAWERPRRKQEEEEGEPAQVLVGATRSRLLDFIRFERAAHGLDQGHRHFLADQYVTAAAVELVATGALQEQHGLVRELGLDESVLFDLIATSMRLKMAVRGGVAEKHLETLLQQVPGVTECHRLEGEGQPDISLRWKGSEPILVECKNALRQTTKDGHARVDFQRTRASKSDPASRYYKPSDFDVLAVCLHAVEGVWQRFAFARTEELGEHPRHPGRIYNNLNTGGWPLNPSSVFDAVVRYRQG